MAGCWTHSGTSSGQWANIRQQEGRVIFICIEGIDASGKATQSKLLATKMEAKLFSFPDYDTPMGHVIRGHLQEYWSAGANANAPVAGEGLDFNTLNAFVFQALQLTNRIEHAARINELLNDAAHIVADRYWQSGWVYGQADGLDPEWLLRISGWLPHPELNLLLDVPAEQSVLRRPERRDRYERQAGLMAKVVDLYRQLWREKSDDLGWVVINGCGTVEEVHRRVVAASEAYADQRGYPYRGERNA